jgi:hypothetical protein
VAAAPSTVELVATGLFAIALLHTFSVKFFERLAERHPDHAGLYHLLGEVEVVFGFWSLVLMLTMFAMVGRADAVAYLDQRNFTEPMFVFAIMVVAGTRPILQLATAAVRALARWLPIPAGASMCLVVLSVVPLLGSLITEPAAMTLAALMLRASLFTRPVSTRLRYGALGVLFVNVSIGGTLTPFAAPPVLMVAGTWGWDLAYMLSHFGWRSALAVFTNAAVLTWLFRAEIAHMGNAPALSEQSERVPAGVVGVQVLFLLGVVAFAHHPPVFLGLLLFFLGFSTAYQRHQDTLILREALMVAFFLAGLVVLGGLQQWWLQPLLMSMDENGIYFGATALTAITDNAALTYLGSLVPGLSEDFKIALVQGAVTGGGLTIIANAPNPAGAAILKGQFEDETIHPVGLLLAALPATVVAVVAFRVL